MGFTDNNYRELQHAINVVTEVINTRNQEDYDKLAMKLNNPKTTFRTYWVILKTFCNGKKVLPIPPLLINNCKISVFKLKTDFFNKIWHHTARL